MSAVKNLLFLMLLISKILQIVHRNHAFIILSVNWRLLLFWKSVYFIRSGMTWNSCCLERRIAV